MKLNWKRFLATFALANLVLFLSGCGWVAAVNALWPALTVAVSAIFSFLTNLSISNPTLEKIQQDVMAGLEEGKTILAELAQNATATVAQKFQAVLQTVVQTLGTILPAIGVTDPTKESTLTKLIGLGVTALEAVLGLIPLAVHPAAATLNEHELHAADKAAAAHLTLTHKQLQDEYHQLVSTSTDSQEVNAALAGLHQTLP